jgi:hypothetical protein
MSLDQINERFLTVGYNKRDTEGETSPAGRSLMGRKGIGKLALFSLAQIIEVHTCNGAEKHAFEMDTEQIKAAVQSKQTYYPNPITFQGPSKGTRLVLKTLKKRRTVAVSAIRRRIARRFSIIGWKDANGKAFSVSINGTQVGSGDRVDLKAIEFLWSFGPLNLTASDTPNLAKSFIISNVVGPADERWTVTGWLGAASEPKKLRHDEAGSLNGIVVFARGRLIQENILDKLGYSRLLGNYITGQVEADFLDVAGQDDIATSDRQRLIEDDPRYVELLDFLRKSLVSIQDQWTELRNAARGKDAMAEIPVLAEWVSQLPDRQQKGAERLLGLIRSVDVDDEEERRQLYRSGMLAFERLKLRDAEQALWKGPNLTASVLLPLLSDVEALEGSLYRDIVRGRLEVIKKFENLVDANEKEKVLHEHLFKNLWLLDPGWERANSSERTEQTLKKDYKEFATSLSDEESKGRIDIRYRTNGGEHILIELKRADRQLSVPELLEQGQKYVSALTKILNNQGISQPHISVVFVVGNPPVEVNTNGLAYVTKALDALNARFVHYEELIRRAHGAYGEFMDQSKKLDKVDLILNRLDEDRQRDESAGE